MTDSTPPAQQEDSPQLKFELMQADDFDKYLLHSKKEILFILRAMRDKGSLITVYFNQGNDFLLTTLLSIAADGNTLLLDPGSNAEMNRKALASDKLIFIATHEKVKIQFIVTRLENAEFEGRPAFRAALPDTLLRLQRREYYRLTAPIAHPLKCVIPVKLADGSTASVETTVIDISGGGLAVMAPPEGVEFETDHLFENCRIELPEVGTVTATLRVRNIFEFTLRNGSRVKRSGCQFEDLPGHMLTLIQRYIIRVERERKARETGLM
ncbi:MAG: flagellar brake protein [Rhodocyclaceae bacterium]|jgi:c-di-GMP-binding flagellar brake protein YcgR|nr:flagellar brake protein [Rhodocyclaceae bacterium]